MTTAAAVLAVIALAILVANLAHEHSCRERFQHDLNRWRWPANNNRSTQR